MLANLPRIKARRLIENGEYWGWSWKQHKILENMHLTAYGDAEAAKRFANEFVCQQQEAKYDVRNQQ